MSGTHLLVSDLDLRGSGYMNIAVGCALEMYHAGKEVRVIGIGYRGTQHNFPFQIIPVNHGMWSQHVPAMLMNLQALGMSGQIPEVKSLTVALDIPLQTYLMSVERPPNVPYIGIFPVESAPLRSTWTTQLAGMDARLVISKFGVEALEHRDLSSRYIEIGMDTDKWRIPTPEERTGLRKMMGHTEDDFVIVTVADNQERKNLSAAMEIIKRLKERVGENASITWHLVTRPGNIIGWDLADLANDMGLTGNLEMYDRGIEFEMLWKLVAMADVFLLTSKAEGLCMPIMEAMAAGTIVLATDCTAIPEHIFADPEKRGRFSTYEGERGFLLPVEFVHCDPWGNSNRHYVDVEKGADVLAKIYKLWKSKSKKLEEMRKRARAYVEGRHWDETGRVLNETIDALVANAPAPPVIPAGQFQQRMEEIL